MGSPKIVKPKTKQARAKVPAVKPTKGKVMQTIMRQANTGSRRGWKSAIGALTILAAASGSALAGPDGPPTTGGSEVIPAVIPTRPYGFTYGEWLAKWWEWSLSFPVSADPENGTAPFSDHQFGDVWFLPAPLGGGTTTMSGSVPEGVALFVPVLTFEADNTGCPTYTDFTVDQLTSLVEGGWSAVATTSCTIDGVAVQGMEIRTQLTLPGADSALPLHGGIPRQRAGQLSGLCWRDLHPGRDVGLPDRRRGRLRDDSSVVGGHAVQYILRPVRRPITLLMT